ncbi:MAG: trigger factor [Bacilli bacterium]|jgi:trigger factor|nr:trigger factor [Bacilli bacterium]
MKTEIKKNENSVVSVKVSANQKVWQDAVDGAYKKAGEEVEIDGFRKGHAPLAQVKKHVNKMEVLNSAADAVLNDMYVKAVSEHELFPIAYPRIDIDTLNDNELEVIFNIAIKPTVELGVYKGLKYSKEEVLVSDEEIEQQVEQLKASAISLEVQDKVIENGDTAVIDFEGFKDGVAFEGGKGEGYPLKIGSNSFIPGFEEQLLNHKAEDEVEVEVTFPEEYQAADLAGKPVIFKVKIHEVKVEVTKEFNDEYVKELGKEDVSTVEELKADIHNNILNQKEAQAESKVANDLLELVAESTKMVIPNILIEDEAKAMYEDFMNRIQQKGMNEEMFLQISQKTKEEVIKEMETDSEKKIKFHLTLEAIADTENIEVSDEEVEAKLVEMASMYNMPVEQVKQYMGNTDSIKFEIKLQKAMDIIKDNAIEE